MSSLHFATDGKRNYHVSYLIPVAPSNGELYEVTFRPHEDFGWEVLVQPPEDNGLEFFFNTNEDPTIKDASEYLFKYAMPFFKRDES
jgi:hypothetical protein